MDVSYKMNKEFINNRINDLNNLIKYYKTNNIKIDKIKEFKKEIEYLKIRLN